MVYFPPITSSRSQGQPPEWPLTSFTTSLVFFFYVCYLGYKLLTASKEPCFSSPITPTLTVDSSGIFVDFLLWPMHIIDCKVKVKLIIVT